MERYLVSDAWGHIFAGSREETTKWVLDLQARKLICGFIREWRGWTLLGGYPLLDLQEDVEQNVLSEIDDDVLDLEDTEDLEEFGLVATNELPDWAKQPLADHRACLDGR